jgi:hypothetical protein
MKNERDVMASLLARLTEAGWVSRSYVSDGKLQIVWTPKGKQCMCALYSYRLELAYLSEDQDETLMFLLTQYFPGGVEPLLGGDEPPAPGGRPA